MDSLNWPKKMKVSEYQDRVSKMLASYGFTEKKPHPNNADDKGKSHFVINMIPKSSKGLSKDNIENNGK